LLREGETGGRRGEGMREMSGEGSDGIKWLLLNVSNLRIRTKSL